MVEINYLSAITAALATLVFLVLFFVVLIANPASQINRLFAIYLLCSFAWGVFTFGAAWNVSATGELIFNRLLNIVGVYGSGISYFFFGLIFLHKKYKPWFFYAIPIYLAFIFMLLTNKVSTIEPEPFLGGVSFHARNQPQELLYLSILLGGTFLLILFVYLIKDLVTLKDRVRRQKVHLLALATLVGGGFAAVFNSYPSLWVYPLDLVGQLLTAIILTYAILRFELVDVSIKLRNWLVDLVFTSVLATIFFVVVVVLAKFFGGGVLWLGIITAVFVTAALLPLKRILLRFSDFTFYRTRYDYRETINQLAVTIGRTLDLKNLTYEIVKTTKDTFGASGAHLFVLARNKFVNFADSSLSLPSVAPFLVYLRQTNQVLTEENFTAKLIDKQILAKLKPQLIVPLKVGTDLIGILFVEGRLSKDFYSTEDKNLIYTLCSSAAIALKNASLYQEVVSDEQEIKNLLNVEQGFNQSRNQFITLASHYLRAPLTSIRGYLNLLLGGKLTTKEKALYINQLTVEEQKLASVVEDLITISSLENGKLKLYKTQLNLRAIISKVCEDFAAVAAEKKIKLVNSVKNDIFVTADQQRISQAISNLIDNALKFSNSGQVTIAINNSAPKVEIAIRDTGIGISEAETKRLFADLDVGRDLGKRGLGLFITNLITKAHAGELKVVTKAGAGSTFSLILPTIK